MELSSLDLESIWSMILLLLGTTGTVMEGNLEEHHGATQSLHKSKCTDPQLPGHSLHAKFSRVGASGVDAFGS